MNVGSPRNTDEFEKFEDNGITVYLPKNADYLESVVLTVEKFLWMDRLTIKGIA